MDDDVVFLGAGRPPMRGKDAFAAASRASEGRNRFEGSAEIQEVKIFGEWAYCWTQLKVTIHPEAGGATTELSGPALSILRKTSDGRWVVFRDANMLVRGTEMK